MQAIPPRGGGLVRLVLHKLISPREPSEKYKCRSVQGFDSLS